MRTYKTDHTNLSAPSELGEGPEEGVPERTTANCSRWLISLLFIAVSLALNACGTSLDRSTMVSGPVAAPTATASPTPTPYFYEVQPGDALWLIAQRFGIDVETLAEVNELENPHLLQPGQRLLISDRVTISGRVLPTATPTPIPCLSGCRQQIPGCDIKGVIARLDGTRLYLLPEDALYPWRAADLWFCREEDAQRAGWHHWTPHGPVTP